MDPLLDLKTASERLGGLSIWTLRRWAYDGRISSVKVSTRLLLPESEVNRLIEEGMRPRRKQRPASRRAAAPANAVDAGKAR